MARCKKRTYTTKRKARQVRQSQQEKYKIKLYIYKCKPCRGYHLTKQKYGANRKIN